MPFTPLHRALGRSPGPWTDELLDAAIQAGARETDDLDWKGKLPPAKELTQSDFPKDVAAMANSGGGAIIFGVEESDRAATGRSDPGDHGEAYERALRSAAITAITPPIFGLKIHRLQGAGYPALVVEVPASVDGPHLIFKNHFFGAPVRNDADTVWMQERQIEEMYRARFNERRGSEEALSQLYEEAARGRDTNSRAWLIAVARPRLPVVGRQLSRNEAISIFHEAEQYANELSPSDEPRPFRAMDLHNPRPGLRRWIASDILIGRGESSFDEAWGAIHRNGSTTIAAAVGGHPTGRDCILAGSEIPADVIELCIADFAGLVRATAEALGTMECDVRVGIEWTGADRLHIVTVGPFKRIHRGTPIGHFMPVETTTSPATSSDAYRRDVYYLALDCLNQGGLASLNIIPGRPPEAVESH